MDARRGALIIANIWFAAGVATSNPTAMIVCVAAGFLWCGLALLRDPTKEKADAKS
jgi:hypothetical protein